MAASEQTETDQQHRAQRTTVILIIVLAITAGAISWYGIRPGNEMIVTSKSKSPVSNAVRAASDNPPLALIAVDEIRLPHFEPMMPLGPHREVFMTNCITCHSPRLVIDQPHFSQKKWEEIVNKMVVTFGGHVYKKDQPKIVEYLVSIRGKTE